MSAPRTRYRHHHRWDNSDLLGLRLLVQRRMTASAIVIGCAELNQQAVIATNDFPRIYRGKSRSHRVVGVPERALLTALQKLFWGRGQLQAQFATRALWKSTTKCTKIVAPLNTLG